MRCKPSKFWSTAVRQLYHHQRKATSTSGVSFAGHTAAASCEWSIMFFSFKKRHVPTYLSYCPLLPFFWPSRRRKSYFHQVKAMRHETDGGLNNATRYRRSCSETKKSPLPLRLTHPLSSVAPSCCCKTSCLLYLRLPIISPPSTILSRM